MADKSYRIPSNPQWYSFRGSDHYDKVLFNPKGAIPVDFEGDNRLFVVEVEHVVAVFRKA